MADKKETPKPRTLQEMREAQARGEGMIYWFREDRQYGPGATPMWIKKEDVEFAFQPH